MSLLGVADKGVFSSASGRDVNQVLDSGWSTNKVPAQMGFALLAARLEEALEFLRTRFHMVVPAQGRHNEALAILKAPDPAAAGSPDQIVAAHRLAWETFLIVAGALEDIGNPKSAYTEERLRGFVRGPLEDEGRDGSPRDLQFELTVATHFRIASCTVCDGEPDISLLFGREVVGVAAKRVRSLNASQLRRHAKKAAEQINRSGMRGWVALNLDTRIEPIEYDGRDSQSVRETLSGAFNAVTQTLHTLEQPHDILGHMMFGYLASWHPAGSDRPGLHFGVPFRWMCIPRTDADEALFTTFSRSWAERFDRRMVHMQRPDFTHL